MPPPPLASYEEIAENYDPLKNTTRNLMSKYEKAKIVGLRIQQLANGATTLVDTSKLKSVQEIVYAELEQKVLPFIVIRALPNGTSEYWKVKDLIVMPGA
jgi:DNA-directed RNA polymerase I, II, and III subunit RPABC2